ncbi:hypothetical protein D770_23120 [Flammeovirgaceae bacterium 311]|nr:hypothetical protein D770_23120 [Flammeovirgaceae bacterium 311]
MGLALGLTCTLLIILYVGEELSYDRHFTKAERIYRITDEGFGEKAKHWAATPPVLGEAFQEFMPQVEQVGRLHYANVKVLQYSSATGDIRSFEEKEGYYADASITEIFDLFFVKGNAQHALNETNSIVLTEETANRYFGQEDPVGKILVEAYDKKPLRVTGVIRDLPHTTHLKFDYLISMATLYAGSNNGALSSKGWNGFYTYALLGDRSSADKVEGRMADFTAHFYASPDLTRDQILANGIFRLQPLTEIHLHSSLEKEMNPNGDITYVYIFCTAAVLILLVACFNFINIATVQIFKRLKEIGIRKVLGALRSQLIYQFLVESLVVTLLAAVLVVILMFFALPFYNYLTGSDLLFESVFTPVHIAGMLLLVLGVGLMTGLYPAFLVSRFNPINAFKGNSTPSSSVNLLRQGLIVFQFAISIFLIVSTLVIYRQTEYFQRKDLGFDKEQLIAIKLHGDLYERVVANTSSFKNQLTTNPAITNTALVSRLPGERLGMYSFTLQGKTEEEEALNMRYMWADEDLVPSMNIELVSSQNFKSLSSDSATAFILNEAAVKFLGLKDPVGQLAKSENSGLTGPIVGIAKDFHYASLHTQVEPLVIQYKPEEAGYLLVKIKVNQVPETLGFLKDKIKSYAPGSLFLYSFVDENLDQMYKAEKRMSSIFKVFTGFALLISCLGLFGLSAYTAELRTKEIGIRKVLGASEKSILMLLSRNFIKLVLIAILIASPIAWYFMHQWLQDFAYRISISWWIFAIAGLSAIAIALITVSFHAIKAALRNPVRNLRTE